jgi:hypothetical protein
MKTINFVVITFMVSILISSCHFKKNDESKKIKDTIIVGYFTGDIETYTNISCEKLSSITNQNNITERLVKLSKNEFLKIKAFIEKDRVLGDLSECDFRIYLKFKSKGVCIGTKNCICNSNENINNEDLYVIHLIKCRSGYFNYFTKEKLYDDKSIVKYGIPKDYCFRNKPPLERKEFERVIFVGE